VPISLLVKGPIVYRGNYMECADVFITSVKVNRIIQTNVSFNMDSIIYRISELIFSVEND